MAIPTYIDRDTKTLTHRHIQTFIFISFRKKKFVAPQEDIKNSISHCHKQTIRTHACNNTEILTLRDINRGTN